VNDRDQIQLQQTRAFNRDALAAIYDNYHQAIYRYIYRQVGEVDATRDLTSAVFHRFLQAIKNGRGPNKSLKSWLYRTAHNLVIDHYRRQKHRQHAPLKEDLIDANDNPVTLAEQRISADIVRAALQHLTPDQRQVITLKFLEGLSNQEVAEITNKPIGAVKSLQHRALAALQRRLASSEERMPL